MAGVLKQSFDSEAQAPRWWRLCLFGLQLEPEGQTNDGRPLGEAMSPLRTVIAVGIAACVGDCAADRAQIANYAQSKMVGLTKEAVLACMGSPASKATEGATEVWSYPSGNCTANVTMMDGKVKRMNYVGPTGDLLSQNEQCFFTVANCTY
jgi:hypothetical protein